MTVNKQHILMEVIRNHKSSPIHGWSEGVCKRQRANGQMPYSRFKTGLKLMTGISALGHSLGGGIQHKVMECERKMYSIRE